MQTAKEINFHLDQWVRVLKFINRVLKLCKPKELLFFSQKILIERYRRYGYIDTVTQPLNLILEMCGNSPE